jgi:hypothetical protein
MEWWRIVENIVGSAIGGSVVVLGLSKYLGERWLEGLKARYGKELAEIQNTFSMGATSHMATVAFDRHIGFCEEYVEVISRRLYALIEEGPAYRPMNAGDFSRIRQKWALWLTQDIETELDRFEDHIGRIGADGLFLSADGSPESSERNIKPVIAYLRNILAIEELTALRRELVVRSSKQPL